MKTLISILFAVVLELVMSFVFMIAIGNLHAVMPMVPTIGYWDSLSVTVFLSTFIYVAVKSPEWVNSIID